MAASTSRTAPIMSIWNPLLHESSSPPMASADTLETTMSIPPSSPATSRTHSCNAGPSPTSSGPPGGLHALGLQGGDGRGDVVGVTGADRHVRPLVGERVGDGASDAPRGPGDDGVQTVQSQIHVQLPSR